MNEKKQALYDYLIEHAEEATRDWTCSREIRTGSDYSADAPREIANKVIEQNTGYVKVLAKSLLQTKDEMQESIAKWTKKTAADRVQSNTTLNEVAKNLGIFREVFWRHIKAFIKQTNFDITVDDILEWERIINYALDYIFETFTAVFMEILFDRLKAQSNLIMELSSPIIPLSNEIGLLPLIGDIDTTRAKWILESTLEQSVTLKINQLIIDLSGVVAIDQMVAFKLLQVVQSLKLIGVQTTFIGIRPEVAQAAVTLGFTLENVRAENSLSKVLNKLQQKT